MIQFKNKTVKIIFYIIYSFLTLVSTFMVVMSYRQPSSSLGASQMIMMFLFCLLLPTLLMVIFFTQPTPQKKRPDKKVRYGFWIPISTFLILSILAIGLTAVQSNDRCKNLVPDGLLWDCDLSGRDLKNIDLHGANMTRTKLTGAVLSDSNLSRTNLEFADLSGSALAGADLTEATLIYATLDGADLSGTILDGTRMKFASLIDVKGLTADSLAKITNWEGMLLQSEADMLSQLWPVCNGEGAENAAEYLPGQRANSILLISEEGKKHPIAGTSTIEDSYWLPESVSNTELVACFSEPQKINIGICKYDDGTTIDQSMLRIKISIFVARTGELLEDITLDGERPKACPEKKVAGGEMPDDVGEEPTGLQIINALRPYVNETGRMFPPSLP
jgi:hypothetical protein